MHAKSKMLVPDKGALNVSYYQYHDLYILRQTLPEAKWKGTKIEICYLNGEWRW